MTKRRNRGEGGLRWSESRQRWIAEVTIGYTPSGKRIVKSGSHESKTEAGNILKRLIREYEDGEVVSSRGYTVADAVNDWLKYGLTGRSAGTIATMTSLANTHVIPALGERKLNGTTRRPGLTADDVDKWLAEKSRTLATRTLRDIRSILRRSIARAQARDKVKRNVALLCDLPAGQPGRTSKALTFEQAEAVLNAAEADESTIGTYIVVSLLGGARTEEMRPLPWAHVDLKGRPKADPPVPPHIMVWRSVRVGGDTKTRKSRRTLALPARCVAELKAHKRRQARWRTERVAEGLPWIECGLVFASESGTELDAANVRRQFRRVLKVAGLNAYYWTPRELRHSFVSLLSDDGVPIEQISRLVGHSETSVTELVYRHQIRPVVQDGASVIDRLFPGKVS